MGRPEQSLSDGMLVSQGQSQGTQLSSRSREPLGWGSGGVQKQNFRLPHPQLSRNRLFALCTKPRKSDCLGPQTDFSFLRMVKGLFDGCFYSSIKPPWSSVCKPVNTLNTGFSLGADEPIKDI